MKTWNGNKGEHEALTGRKCLSKAGIAILAVLALFYLGATVVLADRFANRADALLIMAYGLILTMAVITCVLLLVLHMQRKQQKELIFRNMLFDDLAQSVDDVFIIRDAKSGRVNYCAGNIERVIGLKTEETDKIKDGLSEEDAGEISRVIRNQNYPFPFEKVAEYHKGKQETCWLSIRIYRTGNLDNPQLIIVLSDCTQEITSKQALQDAMLAAEHANVAKSHFLSRMSHEIRTPLNAIIGMTTIAAATIGDSAKTEDCLTKINFSSKHLLMLINDILDMSKIESNKMALKNEPFDLSQVMSGYAAAAYAQAKEKRIIVTEKMEGFGQNVTYIGDSMRLNQILLNLSSNAIKFTLPGGRIDIKVTRQVVKNEIDVIRFMVSDTGIGMAADALDRIFEPFEQADKTIAEKYGGTGLGMPITKNLVILMNGKISLESEPGRGTVVTVDIPLKRSEVELEEQNFADWGLRALVVDDERQTCEQTAALLEKIMIHTQWTVSGTEAAEKVCDANQNGRDYHLCLIDREMSDMDGIEVTKHIREQVGGDIPIIMISTYDISETEEEARAAGADGFLQKPLCRSLVYAAVKEALERRKEQEGSVKDGKQGKPLEGRKLLVVEDNELNREIATELLRMNGAEVRCASDGREALDMFLISEPGDYDAILMDVQMPVMDGHEAARRIRSSGHMMAAYIPIIATTANAFNDDVTAALAAGMNAHISKPLDVRQLCQVLNECIAKAEKSKE